MLLCTLPTVPVLVLLAAGHCRAAAPAQESRPAEANRLSTFEPGGGAPAATTAASRRSVALAKPTEVEVAVAKRDGVKVRCYPSESGLLFDKTLRKDEKVLVRGVDHSGRYHDVEVLSGLPCFVNVKFVQATEPGKGKTSGNNVALRARPRGGEPPASLVTQGVEFKLLQREGEWWRVLAPAAVQAFVDAADLALVGRPAGHEVDLAALREQAETTWNNAVAAERTRLAHEAQGKAIGQKIQDAAGRLEREKQRPVADADFQGVIAALQGILDEAAKAGVAESPAVVSGQALLQEARRSRVLQEAHEAASAVPPKANLSRTPPPMKIAERDPLARFDGIGHLVYRPTADGATEYQLVKGGQLLFYVSCSSGKYELATFNNRELGLRGTASRPEGARVRVLDVSHIEVLSTK